MRAYTCFRFPRHCAFGTSLKWAINRQNQANSSKQQRCGPNNSGALCGFFFRPSCALDCSTTENAKMAHANAATSRSDKPVTTTRKAYSIREFCHDHGIGRTLLYFLGKEGKGPRVMKVGGKLLISDEDAAAWRKAMAESSVA
jgi:hypothetical protein